MLEFASGQRGFIYLSFTVKSELPPLEIHGTDGAFSIQAHDDGRGIRKYCPKEGWKDEPSPDGAHEGLDWGKGVADFADAIRNDRAARCSGTQARHLVEIAEKVVTSYQQGLPVDIESRFEQPVQIGIPAPWEDGVD